MPLKRFNYKISRQISCPYAGGVLASQWKWIKQLSLDTVYLFSEETWRGTHVMHRFKLRQTERPPPPPNSSKRVVRQRKSCARSQGDNLSATERHWLCTSRFCWKTWCQSSGIANERERADLHHCSASASPPPPNTLDWEENLIERRQGKICGFHWIPEGPE